jgi:hypothetical protein
MACWRSPVSTSNGATRRTLAVSSVRSQRIAIPPESTLAAAHSQQALALAEELGMRPLMAHCHLGLGKLCHKVGQREQASVAIATAIDLYRTMEMRFWLPQAESALVQRGVC